MDNLVFVVNINELYEEEVVVFLSEEWFEKLECFVNCEFFWLQFNCCVFEEMLNNVYLLLECVCFLLILVINFDEFFMVCVVGFEGQVCQNIVMCMFDGKMLFEQFDVIFYEIDNLQMEQQVVFVVLQQNFVCEDIFIVCFLVFVQDDIVWFGDEFV